jgi:putative tributyrin esterase
VLGFVDRTFQTIPERRGRVLGGLSMGGYGAVKLALKVPQLFCSAVSHSAALDVRRRIERPEVAAEMRRIFGPSPGGGPDDPYALAEQIDRQLLPARKAKKLECVYSQEVTSHFRLWLYISKKAR